MKILPYRNLKNSTKILFATSALLVAPLTMLPQTQKKNQLTNDVFEKTYVVPPKGTSNDSILCNAPSPLVTINGQEKTATIVVDISRNVLYKYNEFGVAQNAYLIASGKPSTPTDTGIRVVSHIETYPYRTAPKSTKRYKNPNDYGPKIIILQKLDPITGETSQTGEFIHGNNDPSSIGKYASKGCMRMDNEVIKLLSTQVKRGDIVVIDKF